MIPPHAPAYPLPPMDETAEDVIREVEAEIFDREFEWKQKWAAYSKQRRAHAEAIGRPYPAERHAVWPR